MYKTRSRNFQHAIERPKESLSEKIAKRIPTPPQGSAAVRCILGGQRLEIGGYVIGRVKKVLTFGVVLIVDELEGFIHVSEISHQWVRNPSDHFAVGDTVSAQVISIDMVKNRIALSLKRGTRY